MSSGTNKNKDLIYFIPVIIIIALIYLVLSQNNNVVEELPIKETVEEVVEIDTAEVIEKEIENNKEKINMENMKTGEIHTTESGLQYEILKLGDGPKPTSITDLVEVHYHGTLEDGTVFDSSVERNEKISFRLNQVISGWTEGLQLMPVGSKFRFIIPANLAYGDTPMPSIPAGSTLIFEVELFGIN